MGNIQRLACALAVSCQAAVAFAAIPGAGGVISACYDSKGIMRVIDAGAGATCTNKETLLTFNATGTTGPPGPTGPSDAYVTPIDGFSPISPGSAQTIARLRTPRRRIRDRCADAIQCCNRRGSCITS